MQEVKTGVMNESFSQRTQIVVQKACDREPSAEDKTNKALNVLRASTHDQQPD